MPLPSGTSSQAICKDGERKHLAHNKGKGEAAIVPATTAVDTAFLHCGGLRHRQMTGKLPCTHIMLRFCRQHCCFLLASACCGGNSVHVAFAVACCAG